MGSLKRTVGTPDVSSTDFISLIFAARSYRDLSSWHWNTGLGGLVWDLNSFILRYLSGIFIYHTWMCDLFHVCASPTSVDGHGFFNSVVVRIPFYSISDGSE